MSAVRVLDVPDWDYEGGAVWWRHEGESGDEQRPHRYRRHKGHAWRWNPGNAGTDEWCIMLLRALDGQTWARSSLGGIALDKYYARVFAVPDRIHEQSERATRLWLKRRGGAALRALALYAPLETERLAIREGLDWPLHLALACEQLRGLP